MLFSSLGKKVSSGEEGNEISSSISPQNNGSFPCAIQIYSNKYIDFNKKKKNAGSGSSSRDRNAAPSSFTYASLTYQAVFDPTMTTNNPALGVWDLRYNPNNRGLDLTSLLLQKVALKSSNTSSDNTPMPITILLTVDITEPKTVYSNMKSTLDVLVQYFTSIKDSKTENGESSTSFKKGGCCTTSIYSLATATYQFGKAPDTVDANPKSESSYPDIYISFIIAGILPSNDTDSNPDTPTAPAQSYMDKQAQNLVFYHLHQFAKTTNCALLFTTLEDALEKDKTESTKTDDGNSSSTNGDELMALVKYLHTSTTGQNVLTQSPSSSADDNETSIGSNQFHLPNTHDEEVISGVILRNASCEGYWDASKDSLEKALPNNSNNNNGTRKVNKETGDPGESLENEDAWLGMLAIKMAKATGLSSTSGSAEGSVHTNSNNNGSVGGNGSSAGASSTGGVRKQKSEKKGKAGAGAESNKNAESKDVSSFFENLMKPKK